MTVRCVSQTLILAGLLLGPFPSSITQDKSELPISSAQSSKSPKDQSPQAIKRVEANYPSEVKGSRVEGGVQVKVLLDNKGNIINTDIISGPLILRAATLKAAKQWKFSPMILNGKPVKTEGVITFCFSRKSATSQSSYKFTFEFCCPGNMQKARRVCEDMK